MQLLLFYYYFFFLGSISILWHEENDSPADNFMFLKINFIWLSLWSETLESHQLIILFYLSWNKIYTFMSMLDICYSNCFTCCIQLYYVVHNLNNIALFMLKRTILKLSLTTLVCMNNIFQNLSFLFLKTLGCHVIFHVFHLIMSSFHKKVYICI